MLQLEKEIHFQATVCKKKRSTMKAVCGAFGHSKLVEPLDIQEPVRLSITECSHVSTTQVLTTEDGRQIHVPKGSNAMYKYLDTGEVTLSEGNVACEGGELKIGGKKHSNIVEFVTIEYSVTTVEVTEANGHLKTNEGILPAACALAYGSCALEDMTLVIDTGKVNRCRYVEVRKANFQRFQYGGKKLLISDEHKILLEEGEEEPLLTDCLGRGGMRKTNFPRLFIYEGEPGRETLSRMQSTEVDLELETRVTDFYMEYWALSLSMEGQAEWQGEFCELGASRLTEERVVLHGDLLLRMKGEMVPEFKCK